MNTAFKEFERLITSKIPKIPKLITEEWLIKALQNELFSIWGFTFSDLSNSIFEKINEETLNKISISSYTKLPKNHPFNLDIYSLIDKDIQRLHNHGITGQNVNIAIIDHGFPIVHNEVKNCLKDYKDLSNQTNFHGLVVTSCLAGKNFGVAPDAKIHFYGHSQAEEQGPIDIISALKDIYNKNLNGANIKIVNLSNSLLAFNNESENIKVKLKEQGCYIIDSTIFRKYFTCINLKYINGTPNYYFSKWQEKDINTYKSKIAIPFTGIMPLYNTTDDYQISGNTAYSWTIPRLSGIFALCLQVKPSITLEEFIQVADETKTITEDKIMIINPKEMIENLGINFKEDKN